MEATVKLVVANGDHYQHANASEWEESRRIGFKLYQARRSMRKMMEWSAEVEQEEWRYFGQSFMALWWRQGPGFLTPQVWSYLAATK